MKESVVIIVDSFYPNMTMSGNIAKKIVDELIKNGNDVRIITYKSYGLNVPTYKNVKITYLYNWSYYYEGLLAEKNLKKPSLLNQILYYLKKIISNIERNCSKVGVKRKLVKKIVTKTNELYEENPFDVLLSIAAPFEFQVANYEYAKENKKIRSVIYQVDDWVTLTDRGFPGFLQKLRSKKRETLLKKMGANCELVMTPIINTKEGTGLNEISELPLLENNCPVCKKQNNDKIIMVYAGSMSLSERNPSFLINNIVSMDKDDKLEMHFYHRGDCNVLLNHYQMQYPGKIFNHGTVPSDKALEAIRGADVLVMIGTPKGDQIAGKTYESLSTGKKILYISQNEKDVNVQFLTRYPLFLELCENKENNIQEIYQFLIEKYDNMQFNKIKSLYTGATAEDFCKKYIYSK